MRKVLTVLAIILLPLLAVCGPGRDEQAARPAAAPDTAARTSVEQFAPAATRRPAQKAWDTADSNSFDVEELNRRRREREDSLRRMRENPPPLTRQDTVDMLKKIQPDSNGAYSYLQPSEFPGLPVNIASWLEEREYLIPQVIPIVDIFRNPEWKYVNVVEGQFINAEKSDLLVYCVNSKGHRLILFESKNVLAVEEIDLHLNSDYDLSCCSLWIGKIDPEYLKNYNKLKEGQDVNTIENLDHQGITLGDYYRSYYSIYKYQRQWLIFNSTDDE